MNHPLAALWNEHRSIAAVLHALRYLVDEHGRTGKPLDAQAIRAILYYLDVFPERVHHPKEERFLFAVLRRKTDLANDVLDVLKDEHASGEGAIRDLEHLLLCYEEGGEPEFAPLREAVERYVEGYRAHMRREEEVVMQIARKVLTDDDWHALRAEWASHRDPLSGIGDESIGDRLIARIVELAPPPIGVRTAD